MCELFGFTAPRPVRANEWLREFYSHSAEHPDGCTAWVEDGMMTIHVDDEAWSMPTQELAIQGLHNLYNSMAASISASVLHIKNDVIRRALSDFQAVEHRLEYVRTLDGVRWINDSKATNLDSTITALKSFENNPSIWLILGGRDKGASYEVLLPYLKQHCKRVLTIGESMDKIERELKGEFPLTRCETLARAVSFAAQQAVAGDVVLLSPACASFDQFKSFEERGEVFKELVKKL